MRLCLTAEQVIDIVRVHPLWTMDPFEHIKRNVKILH